MKKSLGPEKLMMAPRILWIVQPLLTAILDGLVSSWPTAFPNVLLVT
jgi:hypothetical protein